MESDDEEEYVVEVRVVALSSFPSAAPSATPSPAVSPLLRSLLARTPPAVPYLLVQNANDGATESLLELSHSATQVSLRTPTALVQQLSFSIPVLHALPAALPLPVAALPTRPPPPPSDLFSPFRTPPPPAWTDLPLPLPVAPTDPLPVVDALLQAHLVVLHQAAGIAYPPTGSPITFHLPVPPNRAWPLVQGVLLEHTDDTLASWLYDPKAAPSAVQHLPHTDSVVFASTSEPNVLVTTSEVNGISVWEYQATELTDKGHGESDAKELNLRLVWASGERPKDDSSPTCVVFDCRSEGATLAMWLPKESMVLLLQLEWTHGSRVVATPLSSFPAVSIATVLCTRVEHRIADLLLLTPTSLVLLPTANTPPLTLELPTTSSPILSISSPTPPSPSFLLHLADSTRLITDLVPPDSWSDIPLWTTAAGALSPSSFSLARQVGIPALFGPPSLIPTAELEALLLAFHALSEQSKLLSATRPRLKLVATCAAAMGLRDWVDHYRRCGFSSPLPSHPPMPISSLFPSAPPSTFQSLYAVLASQSTSVSTPLGSSIKTFFGSLPPPLSATLAALYSARTALAIHEAGFTKASLEELKWAVRAPLREVLRCTMADPPVDEREVCDLVGRNDLMMLGESMPRKKRVVEPPQLGIDKIHALGKEGKMPDDRSAALQTRMPIVQTPTRFNEDRRLEEVERMLQFSDPVTITAGDKSLDQLTPQVQQNILSSLANRTFALPVGYAMFRLHSSTTSSPTTSSPPRVCTSARILPMPSPVALLDKEPRDGGAVSASAERAEWPDFHAGVASALQLPSGRGAFDAAQLAFTKPTEPDSKHAGFLLGLGLNGRLSALGFNQAFEYLKAKHDPTSIGLLLGLSVAYLGTGDSKVTSLLTVHLAALHPSGASPLNVSGITQAAALVGVGLLYLGSGRRSLADIMVRELCSITVTRIEDPAACREAYALSAGFAFGLVMLGAGAGTPHKEVTLLRTFRALILGERTHPLPGAPPSTSAPDVHITSPAATIAVGLMYLRTERVDVAAMLEVPDTLRRLDYVRADLLLLRTLARCLIMWDGVSSSKAWVESHVPAFIADGLPSVGGGGGGGKHLDPDLDIARWNIIAGACFGMGLKFAGTAGAEAHATLIHYLDRLTRAAYVKAATVQGKVKRTAIRACLSVVACSLAMVMAGTGEINALRRLRVAHGHFSEGVTYGTHLASHMALGLLFVSGGHYTLGTSNSAIAALILAFYPSYPPSPTENRAHLQAYRHLWTLAVEPRCLQVRDVDTGEPTFLPVKLRLVDKTNVTKSKQLVAPTLIPEIKLIETIQIDSPRYWPFILNLAGNERHRASFLREATIYVKRRTGHLSYAQDPRGIKSIFTRSKSETGSSVFDFGETARMLAPSATGLRDFVSAFTDDAEAIAAVAHLCHPAGGKAPTTAFEAFSASVLLECLTRDKRDAISLYQSMFLANALLHAPVVTVSTLAELDQLDFILTFYSKYWKSLFGRSKSKNSSSPNSSRPEPLIQPALIFHARRRIVDRGMALVKRPAVAAALRMYLTKSTWPDNGDVGRALAVYLRSQNAPDLTSLEELRRLAQAVQGSGEVRKDAVSLVVHGVGKEVEQEGGSAAWSEHFSRLAVEIWLS